MCGCKPAIFCHLPMWASTYIVSWIREDSLLKKSSLVHGTILPVWVSAEALFVWVIAEITFEAPVSQRLQCQQEFPQRINPSERLKRSPVRLFHRWS